MDVDFDLIVIGSGASGGTLAAEAASFGARVLLIERGTRPTHAADSESANLIEKRPYDDRTVHVNERAARLYMGSGPGGGTAVYGAALLRPSRCDFHPGGNYAGRLPRHLWDWPITYDDLESCYDRAESLYRVPCGGREGFSPLEPPRGVPDNQHLPLAPVNQKLMERCRRAGLNPFRLPLGIERSRCQLCAQCAGFTCPTDARRSAGHLVREAVAGRKALTVLENCEVTSLNRAGNRLDSVTVRNRESDQVSRYRATRYVLAAGAIGSACILMRSGFEHRQLGRNYMMHYSPLVVGIFATATEADTRFVKQVGFGDFYFGTADMPAKMGLVQSLPAPGPLMLKKAGMQRLPNLLLTQLRRRMLPFVGIVEDLPDPQNLVHLSKNGHIHLRHRFSDYDRRRGTAMSKAMCRLLRTAGAMYCVSRKLPSEEHVAHQCGTIRFGTDPEHAVVDRNGRMFEQEDLFVVDGSILPTSLGVGPSLTLMANALRVADILKAEF